MLPSDLTLSALRFILSAKSGQSCKQDCETVDFCNSLLLEKTISNAGKFLFQRWKASFPTLESFFSNGGNVSFQRGWERFVP